MRILAVASIAALGCLFQARVAAVTVYPVAAPTGSAATDGGSIRTALAQAVLDPGAAEVQLQAGTYVIDRGSGDYDTWGLSIKNGADIVLTGASYAGTDPTTILQFNNPEITGIMVEGGSNITITNLAIDYNPLPYTQGTLSNVDATAGTLDLTIASGFPSLGNCVFGSAALRLGTRAEIGGTPQTTQYGWYSLQAAGWELQSGSTWRIRPTVASRPNMTYQALANGQTFVQMARASASPALYFSGCTGATVENVNVYAAPSYASLWRNTRDATLRHLVVKVKPGSTRLLSTDADGIHMYGHRGTLLIENCSFNHLGDDAINLYTKRGVAAAIKSSTELVVLKQGAFAAEVGDHVQIYDRVNGTLRGVAPVTAVVDNNSSSYTLTLGAAISGMAVSDDVFNEDTCGAGAIIRNNYFGQHRGRSLVLKSHDVLVEGNTFENFDGHMIDMNKETTYNQGIVPYNITIRGNQFTHVGDGVQNVGRPATILMQHSKIGGTPGAGSSIRHVLIEGNTFTDALWGTIKANNVAGLILTDDQGTPNTITVAAGRRSGLPALPTIELGSFQQASIFNLVVTDTNPETNALIKNTGNSDVLVLGLTRTMAAGVPGTTGGTTPNGKWTLNSVTSDDTGNNPGTGHNLTYTAGQLGDCGVFDGTSTYVDIPDSATLDGLTEVTLSALVRLDNLPAAGKAFAPVAKDNCYRFAIGSDGGGHFIVGTTGDGWYPVSGVTRASIPAGTIAANTWYHLVGTYDSATGTVNVYVNGALVGTATGATGAITNNGNPVNLGRNVPSTTVEWTKGRIDEVLLLSRASSDIQADYLHRYFFP